MHAVVKQESINFKCMMYFVSPLPLHNNLSKKRKNILGGVTITYAFGEEESGVYTEMK